MPLVQDKPETKSPAESLALDAKARLAEFSKTMLLVYGNLMNYQSNNAQGVSKAEFIKALGKDAKDFEYVTGAIKRLLLVLNPALKEQLHEMVPKATRKTKKTAK